MDFDIRATTEYTAKLKFDTKSVLAEQKKVLNTLQHAVTEAREKMLLSYFQSSGLLLCNESRDLPSLDPVGGDWGSIVALIEKGQVYYSKLYKGRVTYLSAAFYAQVKQYRQRLDKVSPTARSVFEFLGEAGKANTSEIKSILMLSGKAFSQSMNELFKELLVTAIERDRTMNVNWSSFYWGTFHTWELLHPIVDIDVSTNALRKLTLNIMTEKQLLKLLK